MPMDIPKSILRKLLTRYNTDRVTLTEDEQALAQRICFCTLCEYLWVRRLRKNPQRCPSCHKPGWNMPMVNALIGQEKAILTAEVIPQKQLAPKPEGVNQP